MENETHLPTMTITAGYVTIIKEITTYMHKSFWLIRLTYDFNPNGYRYILDEFPTINEKGYFRLMKFEVHNL